MNMFFLDCKFTKTYCLNKKGKIFMDIAVHIF